MTDRFPKNEATTSVREIARTSLTQMHNAPPPFAYEDPNGRLIGCYAPLPYVPHIAPAAFDFMKAIYSKPTLPARTRQMGILAVASVYQISYVEYCHRQVSPGLGFTEQQLEAALAGEIPDGVLEEEAVAFETALKLTNLREPLDDQSFEQAKQVLGEDGVAGLMFVVAGYHFVCMLCNVAGPNPGGWVLSNSV